MYFSARCENGVHLVMFQEPPAQNWSGHQGSVRITPQKELTGIERTRNCPPVPTEVRAKDTELKYSSHWSGARGLTDLHDSEMLDIRPDKSIMRSELQYRNRRRTVDNSDRRGFQTAIDSTMLFVIRFVRFARRRELWSRSFECHCTFMYAQQVERHSQPLTASCCSLWMMIIPWRRCTAQ
jgi:hypothetical protein